MADDKYELLISFPDQSASFVHGFEAGRIWALMKDGKAVITETVSHENADLFSQMAARCDYDLTLKDLGDDWMELRAENRNLEPAT